MRTQVRTADADRRIDRVVATDDELADDYDELDERPRDPARRPRKPSPSVVRKWLERVDDRFMGSPIDLHPNDAILWAMRVTAGEVAYCDEQIRRLEEDELFERPQKVTYAELPSGEIVETEVNDPEQMNRWVRWRDQSMQRMAQYAKMALDVGIEERQIKLAEQQAQQIVQVISAVLTDLGHDLRDLSTREIVRRRLMEGSVTTTATEIPEQAA